MDEFRVSGAMRFEQLQQVLNANAAQRRENICHYYSVSSSAAG